MLGAKEKRPAIQTAGRSQKPIAKDGLVGRHFDLLDHRQRLIDMLVGGELVVIGRHHRQDLVILAYHESDTLDEAMADFRAAHILGASLTGRGLQIIGLSDLQAFIRSDGEFARAEIRIGGELIEPLPTAQQARNHAAECLARLPAPCHSLFERPGCSPVDLSPELEGLYEKVRKGIAE